LSGKVLLQTRQSILLPRGQEKLLPPGSPGGAPQVEAFHGAAGHEPPAVAFRYQGYAAQPSHDAQINAPQKLAVDKQGNLNFAGRANQRIGKISSSGVITTVAGGGEVSGFFFEPET
jgi:hypothetical protein